MRKIGRIVTTIFLIVVLFLCSKGRNFQYTDIGNEKLQQAREAVEKISNRFRPKEDPNQVVVATVACSLKHFELAVTMVKSAVLLSTGDDEHNLKVYVFTVKELFTSFTNRFVKIQQFRKFSFILREVDFPSTHHENWRKLGVTEECMAQKLFLPSLLPEIDMLLYVNPESIFLSPPYETFKLFRHFKKSETVGIATEEAGSVYNEAKGHGYYGTNGINSGVMLMDLKKLRESKWQSKISQLFIEYAARISYGDQDLLNIYFKSQSNEVHEMPCDYNFRTEHCEPPSECSAPEGIKIFQANRDAFIGNKDVVYRHLHGIIEHVLR